MALSVLSGCAAQRSARERALVSPSNRHHPAHEIHAQYQIRCPDRLVIQLDGESSGSGLVPIEPDGRISLARHIRPVVDGSTPEEARTIVAEALGMPREQVRVEVAEHLSQHVYVHGEIAGWPRVVPYQGPETIVEFLQRVGGLSDAAAPTRVQVLRGRVADGTSPELFHINLRAIAAGDPTTNIQLRPGDQVYIGQSRRGCICRWLPPWFRPWFQRVCGMSGPTLRTGRSPIVPH
jgi:protein involved in polysaccharide export with SLBB domain